MTTATQEPRTIRATIHQSAISRVPSFFKATLHDILGEMLQNSRRSGATELQITHDPPFRLIIADDGTGIADPQALLSFGNSQWQDDHTRNEHPAGMGFYSLARRESVTVRTRAAGGNAWQTTLTPQHFTGEADATVQEAEPDLIDTPSGTVISFDCYEDIRAAVQVAARYYPLPVTLNGEPVEQTDYLQDADRILEWQGLRIGLYRAATPMNIYRYGNINFHGMYIAAPEITSSVRTIEPQRYYSPRFDVVDCPELELTLPARKELVKTPFVHEINQAALKAIYAMIAEEMPAPGVAKNTQDEAFKHDIWIRDPRPLLRPWREPAPADGIRRRTPERRPVATQAVILSDKHPAHAQHTLARALASSGAPTPAIMEAEDNTLSGYEWYDRIPRIVDIATTAHYDEGAYPLPAEEDDLPHRRPERITVSLTVQDSEAARRVIELETDVALQDDAEIDLADILPLVTAGAGISSVQLTDLMMDAYFRPSKDSAADSPETQRENAEATLFRTCDLMLETPENALQNSLEVALHASTIRNMPAGTRAVITVTSDRELDIAVEVPANHHETVICQAE